jgi:4-oxalocrotonate tautomerase
MPEVFVHILEGQTLEAKRALVKDITAAVVKNINVPTEAVIVSLVESARTAKSKGGVLFSDLAPR